MTPWLTAFRGGPFEEAVDRDISQPYGTAARSRPRQGSCLVEDHRLQGAKAEQSNQKRKFVTDNAAATDLFYLLRNAAISAATSSGAVAVAIWPWPCKMTTWLSLICVVAVSVPSFAHSGLSLPRSSSVGAVSS